MEPLIKKMTGNMNHWLRTINDSYKIPNEENIHAFRLVIKQMNAYALVLKFPDKQKEHKACFQHLIKAFSIAGRIRNAELQLEHISELMEEELKPFAEEKRKTSDQSRSRFLKKLSQLEKNQLLKFVTAFIFEAEQYGSSRLLIRLQKVLELQFKKLQKQLGHAPDKMDLHPRRIIIRRILELLNLISDTRENEALQKFMDLVRELNKKIGNWHDVKSLYKSISIHQKQQKEHSGALEQLQSELQKEMVNLEIEIDELFSGRNLIFQTEALPANH
ncbi:MAG: CHAD domain-containing protein [Saprospiraceae bacterium]|nr:CHAD domain-containing protein [Saprospiraceae bacterium]